MSLDLFVEALVVAAACRFMLDGRKAVDDRPAYSRTVDAAYEILVVARGWEPPFAAHPWWT